jgi:hypothetical protein
MAISVQANDDRRVLVATATGDLTLAEFQDFVRTARAGDRRGWPLVFDATGATSSITAGQVQALADRVGSSVKREGPRAPVAIVAPADALFGVMRMYQILCESRGVDVIHVFRTRGEADAWLGV